MTPILFIGGGWHVPKSYHKLSTALEAAGLDVHIPTHPTMNESRPPNSDLYTDTKNTRAMAEKLINEGLEVVVVMHSYGGQVGTNALHDLSLAERKKNGLKGGISHLIYMTAAANREGKSQMDLVEQMGHKDLIPLAFDFADDMTVLSRDPKTLLIGENNLPAAEVDAYLDTLVRWNGKSLYQPLDTPRAAWRDVPVTYIFTTKDMTIPFDYQKWYVEEMKKEGVAVQTAVIETGHAPHLTATDEVVAVVKKIVNNEALGDALISASEAASTNTEVVKGTIENVGSSAK